MPPTGAVLPGLLELYVGLFRLMISRTWGRAPRPAAEPEGESTPAFVPEQAELKPAA